MGLARQTQLLTFQIAVTTAFALGLSPEAAAANRMFGVTRRSRPVYSLELDPRKSRNTALRVAARENNPEDIRRLLIEGADIHSRSDAGVTALMFAARSCATESVHLLLGAGANVNAQDQRGRTPLMHAITNSCAEAAQALLAEHPNLKLRDRQERSALDYAERATYSEYDNVAERIRELLLKNAHAHR